MEYSMIVPLVAAMFLGALMGVERAIADKGAGMRTYALVSMGSALFVLVARYAASMYAGVFDIDPLRMAASVITGIGFIGAGLFIFRASKVHNITTAAGLWVSAGIGIAAGFELYFLGLVTALLSIFIFTALWFVQKKITALSDKLLD